MSPQRRNKPRAATSKYSAGWQSAHVGRQSKHGRQGGNFVGHHFNCTPLAASPAEGQDRQSKFHECDAAISRSRICLATKLSICWRLASPLSFRATNVDRVGFHQVRIELMLANQLAESGRVVWAYRSFHLLVAPASSIPQLRPRYKRGCRFL
jgi:hypothetical protein